MGKGVPVLEWGPEDGFFKPMLSIVQLQASVSQCCQGEMRDRPRELQRLPRQLVARTAAKPELLSHARGKRTPEVVL